MSLFFLFLCYYDLQTVIDMKKQYMGFENQAARLAEK